MGLGPSGRVVAEGVFSSGQRLARPAERWGQGLQVVSVAEGVHLERAEPSETQRSGAGKGSRPLSGRSLANPAERWGSGPSGLLAHGGGKCLPECKRRGLRERNGGVSDRERSRGLRVSPHLLVPGACRPIRPTDRALPTPRSLGDSAPAGLMPAHLWHIKSNGYLRPSRKPLLVVSDPFATSRSFE